MRRHWITAFTSLGLAALLLSAPCRALLVSASASEHACCEDESGLPAQDAGCQSRCAAVAKEAENVPLTGSDGFVALAVSDEGEVFERACDRPAVLVSHSLPPSPLYLRNSSLLI